MPLLSPPPPPSQSSAFSISFSISAPQLDHPRFHTPSSCPFHFAFLLLLPAVWCHCGLCCQLFAVSLHHRKWQQQWLYLLFFAVCRASRIVRRATGVPQCWPEQPRLTWNALMHLQVSHIWHTLPKKLHLKYTVSSCSVMKIWTQYLTIYALSSRYRCLFQEFLHSLDNQVIFIFFN